MAESSAIPASTPDLLTALETCNRKGFWSKDWRRRKLDANQMLYEGLRVGLTSTELQYGEEAGCRIMELAENPGLETTSMQIYRSVIHHATLVDLLSTALRPPGAKVWCYPTSESLNASPWVSNAFLSPDGSHLRRPLLVSSWSDEKHYSAIRSWYGLGEVAIYNLPMKIAVCVLGRLVDGRRQGVWTQGFRHPQNHQLRFRKKAKVKSEVFSDSWEKVWREDRDEISNQDWLQAMRNDDIFRDVCFTIDIPVMEAGQRQRLLDMASRKLERLASIEELPEPSLSVCDRPPCPFRGCCHSEKPYLPSESQMFAQIETATSSSNLY